MENQQNYPVLQSQIVKINSDGLTKRRTLEGLKEYLRWCRKNDIPVYLEDFNSTTQNFLYKYKLFIPSRAFFHSPNYSGTKGMFWLLGLNPQNKNTRFLCQSDRVKKRLQERKIHYHPDRWGNSEMFKIICRCEEIIKNRQKNM